MREKCKKCAVGKAGECHWLGDPENCGDFELYIDPWAEDTEIEG